MAYPTKEIHLKSLLEEQKSLWESQAIIIGNNCCETCAKRDRETIDIDEVIKLQPLPNIKCTRPNGCVCCYGFQGKRDERGRLIMKK